MFILDTIKPSKTESIILETALPIRYISFLFTVISYLLLYLNIMQYSNGQLIYSFFLLILILVNMYFLLFHRTVKLNNDRTKLLINIKFVGIVVKQHVFPLHEIQDIVIEDRRMGQTISQKLRLFVKHNDQLINIGVVNQNEKATFIRSKLLNEIQNNQSS